MTIRLHLPSHSDTLKPKITVIGVGGAGGNAVNNMIAANLEGVDFVMANTDAQALETAMTDRTVQLGITVTRGLGAGANPQVGSAAAEEALDEISDHIRGSHMVFITAGMGGGTGTGAAPVIARMARGILTVGVVTKPFHFEGAHRMRIADRGIEDLQQFVDTLIVIPNQNLFRVANEKTTFADAFRMADEVLHSGVRGVTDLMVKPGLVNLDFADIRAVMSEMGKAMMGTGEAEGGKRAIDAAESAISNPLLDDVSLKGARAVLINITGGPDMTLFEVDEAANRIRDEVDPEANIIFGSTFSDAMEGRMRVSVVATGIDYMAAMAQERAVQRAPIIAKQPVELKNPISTPVRPTPAEQRRERTPHEIVRDSGTASLSEIARAATENLRQKREVERTPFTVDREVPRDPAPHQASEASDESPRKPFKLGEVNKQIEAPVFMVPRAEVPAQRTPVISQPENLHSEELAGDLDADEPSSGFNFFKTIAGVGRAFSKSEDAAPVAAAKEPAPAKSARTSARQPAMARNISIFQHFCGVNKPTKSLIELFSLRLAKPA